jgi:biotin operon repressor
MQPAADSSRSSPEANAVLALLRRCFDRHPLPARTIAEQCAIAIGTSVENQRRKVRELIKALRDAGHKVCGDNEGYWLARREGEWSEYLQAVRSGARFAFVRARDMQAAATERQSGQGLLYDDGVASVECFRR